MLVVESGGSGPGPDGLESGQAICHIHEREQRPLGVTDIELKAVYRFLRCVLPNCLFSAGFAFVKLGDAGNLLTDAFAQGRGGTVVVAGSLKVSVDCGETEEDE